MPLILFVLGDDAGNLVGGQTAVDLVANHSDGSKTAGTDAAKRVQRELAVGSAFADLHVQLASKSVENFLSTTHVASRTEADIDRMLALGLHSEEAVETTAYLADLIAKGYANVDPIQDEFLNGACATMIGGSWEVATLEANATFDWGVTYYPVSDTGKAVSPCGDWSAAISRDCENVEAAGEFLQWLMSTDNVATYAAAIAKPATRNSAYENEAMADYADGPRALFVEQLNNTAVPRPRTPSYATFSANYAEAMTNIFSDAATNGEVDTDYIQDELKNVAELFTEDYETYYAE